jgi:hypothetical protein
VLGCLANSPICGDAKPVTAKAPSVSRCTDAPRPRSNSASSFARGARTTTSERVWDSTKRSIGVSASNRPRAMITRWSAVSAISLIKWLDTRTVRPWVARLLNNSLAQTTLRRRDR